MALEGARAEACAADVGDPRRARTSGLRFRKPPLYPAELWDLGAWLSGRSCRGACGPGGAAKDRRRRGGLSRRRGWRRARGPVGASGEGGVGGAQGGGGALEGGALGGVEAGEEDLAYAVGADDGGEREGDAVDGGVGAALQVRDGEDAPLAAQGPAQERGGDQADGVVGGGLAAEGLGGGAAHLGGEALLARAVPRRQLAQRDAADLRGRPQDDGRVAVLADHLGVDRARLERQLAAEHLA